MLGRDPILGFDIITLLATILLAIVKGYYELMLLVVDIFWYISSVLFLFAFFIEMICLASTVGILIGFIFSSIHATILGVLLTGLVSLVRNGLSSECQLIISVIYWLQALLLGKLSGYLWLQNSIHYT